MAVQGGNAGMPFEIGQTSTDIGAHLLGMEVTHPYQDPDSTSDQLDGRVRRLRLCKNVSTIALAPKRLVKFSAVAGKGLVEVIGYCSVLGERTAVVDEFLPSGGVAVNDYFWAVVEGPALVTMTFDQVGDISVGDIICAQTAAASTSTSAGRAVEAVLTVTSQATDLSSVIKQAINQVGEALSAVSSSSTAGDLLVEVKAW